MKFCFNYYKEFPYLDIIDEININYDKQSTELVEFLEEHKHQRIHLTINDTSDFLKENRIEVIKTIKEKYPEYNFVLRIPRDESVIKLCKENNIPFWIKAYVSNWDTLTYFLSLGVTDVTIIEEMGFEIDKVAAAAHRCGTKVRILPNVAQSSVMETPGIKKFFVRPEDIKYYEPYVDVCDFFGAPKSVAVYYKIYAIDKEWFGDLNEIIISLNTALDSRFVEPIFGERRLRCGKRCLRGAGCDYCNIALHLANTLKERKLMFKHKKDN